MFSVYLGWSEPGFRGVSRPSAIRTKPSRYEKHFSYIAEQINGSEITALDCQLISVPVPFFSGCINICTVSSADCSCVRIGTKNLPQAISPVFGGCNTNSVRSFHHDRPCVFSFIAESPASRLAPVLHRKLCELTSPPPSSSSHPRAARSNRRFAAEASPRSRHPRLPRPAACHTRQPSRCSPR